MTLFGFKLQIFFCKRFDCRLRKCIIALFLACMTKLTLRVSVLRRKIGKKMAETIKKKPEGFTCIDITFKNNDRLKTNTVLQMEAEKVEFKVI